MGDLVVFVVVYICIWLWYRLLGMLLLLVMVDLLWEMPWLVYRGGSGGVVVLLSTPGSCIGEGCRIGGVVFIAGSCPTDAGRIIASVSYTHLTLPTKRIV
eukprot:TRINITY_DN25358_c0_g1_i2.p1 TRINITY_DN25358_c0_g1~~TRINITY_DN25358_c0_g1_i2.p1  ORF type:complete len:100 (-),score=14.83 TRINITY_DN25358_c0_g1_i2:99-398(-)